MKKFIFTLVAMALVSIGLYGNDTAMAQTDTNDDDLNAEIELLKSEIEELKNTDSRQQQEIDQLREDVDALQEEVDEIWAILESLLAGGEDEEEGPTNDRAELEFDINSDFVRDQFLGTTEGNENGVFMQDAITVGMSQADVEAKYGLHDGTINYDETLYVIYGDLAVLYSNGIVDTESDLTSKEDNVVEFVLLYPDVTEDELFAAFGEANEIWVGEEGELTYRYAGSGEDDRYYVSYIYVVDTDDDEVIGLFTRTISDGPPPEDEDGNGEDGNGEDGNGDDSASYPVEVPEDATSYQGLTAFILNSYLPSLEGFYNENNDETLNYLDGSALSHLQNVRDEGTIQNYTLHESSIAQVVQVDVEQYQVTANLVQEYDGTDGQESATITYLIDVREDGFVISEFQ